MNSPAIVYLSIESILLTDSLIYTHVQILFANVGYCLISHFSLSEETKDVLDNLSPFALYNFLSVLLSYFKYTSMSMTIKGGSALYRTKTRRSLSNAIMQSPRKSYPND